MKRLLVCLFFISLNAVSQIAAADSTNNIEVIYRTTDVDSKPQLSNGMYTLSLFISENFKFQEDIKNKKIIVFSSFIIEPDGTMTDIKAFHVSVKDYISSNVVKITTEEDKINERDQIESMKGETVRVLKLFDRTWIPAKKNGKPVRCLFNYPINFNIE